MAKYEDRQTYHSDQKGQRGTPADKGGNRRRYEREHVPPPESGNQEDRKHVPIRKDLPDPLPRKTERSSTHGD